MKCYQVLKNIRTQRDKSFNEYLTFLLATFGKLDQYSQNSLQTRWEILTLELPFETDTVSVNTALVSSYVEPKDKSIDEIIDEKYPPNPCEDTYENEYRKKITKNALPKLMVRTVDLQGNDTLYTEIATKDDLKSSLAVRNAFLNNYTNKSKLVESSKKTQKSHAKSIIDACTNKKKTDCYPKRVGIPIPKEILANYLLYLENRSLNSYSIGCYKDLIEVRLLLYVSLPINKLQQITRQHIDKASKVIKFEKTTFPVPATFIELVESVYSENERLFNRTSKKINKFVLQTAEAAKLKSRLNSSLKVKLTPSLLKNSLGNICWEESYYKEKLPRR
jgi:hypothetical protein